MNYQNHPDWLLKKLDEYGWITQKDNKTENNKEIYDYFPYIIDDSIYQSWIDTKNPIIIWQTLYECLKRDMEIPKWVKEYLLESAQNIKNIDFEKKEDMASEVYKAFGMSRPGRGTVFSKYKEWEFQYKVWVYVTIYLETHDKLSNERAYEKVSKILNKSKESIKFYYREQEALRSETY